MPSQLHVSIHSAQLSQLPLADPATDGGRVYAQDNRGMAIAVDVRTGGCMSGHMAGAPHRTSRRTYASYFSNRMCGAAARRRCGVEVCCVRPGRLLARVPAGVGRRGVLDLCNLGEQRLCVHVRGVSTCEHWCHGSEGSDGSTGTLSHTIICAHVCPSLLVVRSACSRSTPLPAGCCGAPGLSVRCPTSSPTAPAHPSARTAIRTSHTVWVWCTLADQTAPTTPLTSLQVRDVLGWAG